MDERQYDVVVIGGGSTGENVAGRVTAAGFTAVVVEAELVGGECSYWACMPSKALLRPVQALAAARRVAGARQAVTGVLDAAAVFARRDAFTKHWDDASQVTWLGEHRIDLVRGHARFTGARRVRVASASVDLVATRAVVICTGSVAAIPDVPGLAAATPWTPREATSARVVPRRLAILGGGVVGCEMATAWRALGTAEVTLLQRAGRLLDDNEPFAGDAVRAALEADGVRVLTNAGTVRVDRRADGTVVLALDGHAPLVADELLVAAGRRARTDDLGVETIGLVPGAWLDVDDDLRVRDVAGGWLYAAGDVNHRALLTHMGKYQARICGDVIVARAQGTLGEDVPPPWSRWAATADRAAVPQVVFTEPEVAAVGLTEAEARARGLTVRVVDYDIGKVAGAALHADDYAGRARMVVDESRRVLVGVTLVGPSVGELIHAATVAVVGEVPVERLWHAVPSYPTISELWLRLLEAYGL